MNLAMWLKSNNYECDQVQNFYPSPMCNATAMYYSETNPLKRVKYKKREEVPVAKGERQRRLHKALLRYHDPDNWPMIREALINMGKKYLIGDKPGCLVPAEDIDKSTPAQRRKSGRHGANRFATKHTKNQPDIRNPKSNGKPKTNGSSAGNKQQGGNKTGQGKPAGNKAHQGKPARPKRRR